MGRLLKILAAFIAALGAAAAALYFFVDANQFRPRLEDELSKVLKRGVRVGDLKLELWSGSFAAGDLVIGEDAAFGTTPFLKAKSLKIGVEMKTLIFERKLNVTGLTIENPEIELVQSAAGDWNFASIGKRDPGTAPPAPATAGKGALDLAVKLISVTDGQVRFRQPNLKPLVVDKLNLQVRDFSPSAAFPFTLSMTAIGATVNLDGKTGPIDPQDASLTPVDAKLSVSHLDLAAAGAIGASSGISGSASVDGHATSNGKKIDATGRIRAERLKLARGGSPSRRPVEFDFTVSHDVRRRYGVLTHGVVHLGKAQASLSGSYALRSEPATISMRVDGPDMAIAELLEMLPPMGLVLPSGSSLSGGHAAAGLTFDGPVDRLSVAGPLGLYETKLSGFDLGSKIQKIAAIAGIKVGPDTDIQALSAKVRSTPAGTAVDDIVFVAPAIGELTGSGTIGPQHELDFTMRVKLHTSGMLMNAIGQKGDTTIPFSVRGTSAAPTFAADMKSVAKEKAISLIQSDKVQSIIKGGDPVNAVKGIFSDILKNKK